MEPRQQQQQQQYSTPWQPQPPTFRPSTVLHPFPPIPGTRPTTPGHVQPIHRASATLPFPPTPPAPGYGFQPPPQHSLPAMEAPQSEVLDEFQSLTLGPSAPGGHDHVETGFSLPRPDGTIPLPPVQASAENAHHSFIRMTTGCAPRSASLRERFHLPYGAIVQPLAEAADTPRVPIIKLATTGIQRCKRCRTYINPFVEWIDDGRRWKCNLCGCLNPTPRDYYCSIEESGRRRDAHERLELSCGSVEYVAPPEYMVRAPMPAVYLFVVDVSSAEISYEAIKTISAAIKSALDNLQGDDRKRIGFLTFDRTLHFYNLKASDTAKMLVVPEIDEPFLPQPDDLLMNVDEAKNKIEAFLESWPSNFSSNPVQQSAMGAALQSAFLILSQTGGKLELFLSAPPSLGSGAIINRENPAFYGTEREVNLRNPEDSFYKKFAAECSRVHICVDLYSFSQQYTDLASITTLSKYTGGQVYSYPGFLPQRDAGRLHHDIVRNLTRYTGWEGVMRLRCSKGLKITSFLGQFFIRSTDLLALPTTDPDKSFAIEIRHDETVLDGYHACIQCALLYTASCGERRIRVHTLQFPVTHELKDLYAGADSTALICFLAKNGVEYSYHHTLADTLKMIEGKLIACLREYRVMHSRHFRGANKLIFPEAMKFFPLWILSLLKSPAMRDPRMNVSADERTFVGYEFLSANLSKIIHYLSPTLYLIKDFSNNQGLTKEKKFPPVIPSSYEYLSPNVVYLLDTLKLIFILIGSSVPLDYLSQLSGVPTQSLKSRPLHSLQIEPPQKNEVSHRLCEFINEIRQRRQSFQPVVLMQLGTEQEQHLWSFLVEDRKHSKQSYLDFISMIHRQIGGN